MPTPVIIDAIRTPIGALGGALASVRPDDLAALVIKTIIERNRLDPALVASGRHRAAAGRSIFTTPEKKQTEDYITGRFG